MILGLFSLLATGMYAQVRGTVKDSTGEPVPGANVFWMNTGSNNKSRRHLLYYEAFEKPYTGGQLYRLSE